MPESCDFVTLSELADFNCESLGTDTPAEFTFDYIDLSSVTTGSIDLGSLEQLRFADAPSRARRVVRDGDVLFGTVRPRLRSHALASDGNFVASTGFCVLRPRKCAASGRFLIHYLLSDAAERQARRLEVGSNYPAVTERDVALLEIPQFPLEEQRRIAEILDTIDETIQATERVIAKRTATLDGLVEALAGRSNQVATAHRPLGELLQLRMDYRGRTPKKLGMDWGDGEIPALSANNVQMGRIDFGKECYLGSDDLYQRWMTQGDLERGDLLITMEAPLGNIARVPDDHRYILSQRVVLLRFTPALLLNDFAYWYLRGESFQSELRRRSTGTTATGIRRAELERIEIPLVDLPQQEAVADSLSVQEEAISREQGLLRKLDETRTGLATDLLSGRVRTVAA